MGGFVLCAHGIYAFGYVFVKRVFCIFIFAQKGHKMGARIGFQGEI